MRQVIPTMGKSTVFPHTTVGVIIVQRRQWLLEGHTDLKLSPGPVTSDQHPVPDQPGGNVVEYRVHANDVWTRVGKGPITTGRRG